MGKLIGISMAGVDEKTDLDELKRLQNQCTKDRIYLEFGIILSKNWFENGNRYWDPNHLRTLRNLNLNLCAHLCGSVARAAIQNDWQPALELLGDNASLFKRVQLNIKGYRDSNPKELAIDVPRPFKEVIIQQHASYDCKLFYEWFMKHENDKSISVLIDGSGGMGRNTRIIPLPVVPKVGYAGGISPDNVYGKTLYLLYNLSVRDFWIDMESGLRTNDWFDTRKAEIVITKVQQALENDIEIDKPIW